MTEQELRQYNSAQIKEIKRYKKSESAKAGYDIGNNRAASEWINKYSRKFRDTFFGKPSRN